MNTSDQAVHAAISLLRGGGWHVSEADVEWLSGNDALRPSSDELNAQAEAALRGFFKAASEGRLFVDERRIVERFGRGLVENYPEGSSEFLNFARTYWTLRIVADDAGASEAPAAGLVDQIEKVIAPLFFPTPGPMQVDPSRREADQRRMLGTFLGAGFNVEGFIKGNPILIRDRRAAASGCLGAIALLVAGSGALVVSYLIAAAV